MKDIELLNEKDMEYFERLEEQGEAVILRIEPEVLAALDIRQLKNRHPISLEEAKAWIEKHSEELKEEATKADWMKAENRELEEQIEEEIRNWPEKYAEDTLVNRLARMKFHDEQWTVIKETLEMHLLDEQVLPILREDLTAEEMRQIREWILENN